MEVEDHNTTKNIKRRKCPLQIYKDLSSTILGLFLFGAFRAFMMWGYEKSFTLRRIFSPKLKGTRR